MCNSTTQYYYIEKQTILELEPGCTAQIGKYKLRQHVTLTYFGTKIEKFKIDINSLKWPDIIERSEITNTSSSELVLAGSNEFNQILSEMKTFESKHQSLKTIKKMEETNSIHTSSLIGLGAVVLLIIVVILYVLLSALCPIIRTIARVANESASG